MYRRLAILKSRDDPSTKHRQFSSTCHDSVGSCGEEIVTAEVRVNSLDPACEGSNHMYCKRIPQKGDVQKDGHPQGLTETVLT
ncbi:hypothetical protein SUGI_0280460 [Cryptomeria japonica]|nr:hypothetical protein SUGI_0280460 [Cryptomeria japonica]